MLPHPFFWKCLRYAGLLSLALWTGVVSGQTGKKLYGYFLKGDSICFEFDPKQYAYAVQTDDDKQVAIDRLTVSDVTLEAHFRHDTSQRYPLKEINNHIYHISFPLDTLGKPDWIFRFYVNGYYKVEPPAEAVNRVRSGSNQGYYFTTLLRRETFLRLDSGTLITDQNAQQWLAGHATPINTEPGGMEAIQKLLQSGKIVGIGRSEEDSLQTLPARSALARWLITQMDYHLVAFQMDPLTSDQMERYLEGDSTYVEPNTIEIINMVRWSDLRKSKALDYKPLFMGYQKEDVVHSLHMLATLAPAGDSLLRQDIFQLIQEVNSLLRLQEDWGIYYYNSPSYQRYLSKLWHNINNNLNKSGLYEVEPYDQLKPALAEVRNYLTHLDNLKGYYKGIKKQLSKYFYWMGKRKFDVKFIVWDNNHEISKTQPGSVGKYLRDQYGNQYISVGIGTYDFSSLQQPGTAVSLELPFMQKLRKKAQGQQAFVIDLRTEKLSAAEQMWLEERIYTKTTQNAYTGRLADDYDLIILVNKKAE